MNYAFYSRLSLVTIFSQDSGQEKDASGRGRRPKGNHLELCVLLVVLNRSNFEIALFLLFLFPYKKTFARGGTLRAQEGTPTGETSTPTGTSGPTKNYYVWAFIICVSLRVFGCRGCCRTGGTCYDCQAEKATIDRRSALRMACWSW